MANSSGCSDQSVHTSRNVDRYKGLMGSISTPEVGGPNFGYSTVKYPPAVPVSFRMLHEPIIEFVIVVGFCPRIVRPLIVSGQFGITTCDIDSLHHPN